MMAASELDLLPLFVRLDQSVLLRTRDRCEGKDLRSHKESIRFFRP
jgi:hypothetical protein